MRCYDDFAFRFVLWGHAGAHVPVYYIGEIARTEILFHPRGDVRSDIFFPKTVSTKASTSHFTVKASTAYSITYGLGVCTVPEFDTQQPILYYMNTGNVVFIRGSCNACEDIL